MAITERRSHADGFSWWHGGERHRSQGFAVDRADCREVWLHGTHIETPDHPSTDPLTFVGQTSTGRLLWVDSEQRLRVVEIVTAAGVQETRWFDSVGNPAPHWRGGYYVRRTLLSGERRFYAQADPSGKPLLHRVDGPAIEDAGSPLRSIWCVQGSRVDGPLELLIRYTMRARQAAEHARPMVRPMLADADRARLRITVIDRPESSLATDIAIAFPDEFAAAIEFADEENNLDVDCQKPRM